MDPNSSTVYVDDLVGPLLEPFRRLNEVHGRVYDVDGYGLALADLIGAEAAREVPSERISAVGDLLLDLRDTGLQHLMARLQQDDRFPVLVRKLEWLFRTERGDSLLSSSLRRARCDSVAEFLDVIIAPLEQRLGQVAHAKAERERRHFVRFPLMPAEGLAQEARAFDASMLAVVDESAARIVSKLRAEVRAEVFAALRSLLISTDARRDLAERFGVSEATISRAWTLLADRARLEAQGLPDEYRRNLSSSIVSAFAEAV